MGVYFRPLGEAPKGHPMSTPHTPYGGLCPSKGSRGGGERGHVHMDRIWVQKGSFLGSRVQSRHR
jgi:hypothetical protein